MALRIEVAGFTGSYAGLNAASIDYPVGMAELVNRALTVGGWVVGSAAERTRRRSSISNMVLSSVRAAGPPVVASPLAVTNLYVHTETTEKTGISFRLGMAFAAVAASRILDVAGLQHVAVPGVVMNGRRADLLGLDSTKGCHVVEAKARSYGFGVAVVEDAKEQAKATTAQLAGVGQATTTASASVTDLSTCPITVLLEDPPVEFGDVNDPDEDREARFVHEFYAPVRDLLEVRPPEPSGYEEVDNVATGSWMPGADVRVGLRDDVAQRLADGENVLRSAVETLAQGDVTNPWLVSSTPDGHVVVLDSTAELASGNTASSAP